MKKVLQFRFKVNNILKPTKDHLHFDKETNNEILPLQTQYQMACTHGTVDSYCYMESSDVLFIIINHFMEIDNGDVDKIKESMQINNWIISWDSANDNMPD